VGQDAAVVVVICPTAKAEYFCKHDWTGQITLIRFNKPAGTRNAP
jgi:hypothetical protein